MTILYMMLPLALLLGLGFLLAFIRAGLSGQYEDLETPAYRMLIDDETPNQENPSHGTR